ncbi:hypothetical protein [Streptomyces sp. NPDC005209]|uniref:hypothetical protein n=1 Tax=Streptomyces sp. NPDC005209 TaxID=3156715 RepID=UPI0033A1A2A9
MSDEKHGEGAEPEGDFEERLRELLAEDAYTVRPAPAPYPTIRRQGVTERRQRAALAGAVVLALAAVPVGAYAVSGGGASGSPAAPKPSVRVSRDTPGPMPSATASATPDLPAPPATAGQLLDGITFGQASDGLTKCLAYDRANKPKHTDGSPVSPSADLGRPSAYRIILAMRSTGDSNAPGDGMYVVAVREKPQQTRLICTIRDGEAQGLNAGGGDFDGTAPVAPDINSGKLYQQSFLDKGHWKLPFRWGVVGGVRPSVAKLTVSYGDGVAEATLDHGWFVATGQLHQQVTKAPRLKGYDTSGKLVYDSDQDRTYEKTLP